MTNVEILEHIEKILNYINDIDPTNELEVQLINKRDELRELIREEQCGQGIDPETLSAEEYDDIMGFEGSMRYKYPITTKEIDLPIRR